MLPFSTSREITIKLLVTKKIFAWKNPFFLVISFCVLYFQLKISQILTSLSKESHIAGNSKALSIKQVIEGL